MLTTLELICTIFTVLLPITEPHAGDTVPTGAGKMALLTPVPMGGCGSQTQSETVCFAMWEICSMVVLVIISPLVDVSLQELNDTPAVFRLQPNK